MADPSIAAWVRAHVANPVMKTMLRSPAHRFASGSLLLLDYTGRRTGRHFDFPVQYAVAGDDAVVAAGQHRTKTWWRNFDAQPQQVTVLLRGHARQVSACRLSPGTDRRERAAAAYSARFPKAPLGPDTPLLVLAGAAVSSPRSSPAPDGGVA